MTRRTEYPLCWPPNWPRTSAAARGSATNMRTELTAAIKNVNKELELFAKQSSKGVSEVLISSNVTLSSQKPKDPGVAVYFTWDGIATCIAVDRYEKLEHNLQAIALVIAAERTKMRHGGLNLVRASFMGYTALPGPKSGRPWHEVLGVEQGAPSTSIKAAYQRLRSTHHPDRGGQADAFDAVEKAWQQAKDKGLVT